jgi:hypothetical protein
MQKTKNRININCQYAQVTTTKGYVLSFQKVYKENSRTQWLCGLRRGSAAARLLGSWIRNMPRAWMSVCCECCVLSDTGLCVGLITRPEGSYRWSVLPSVVCLSVIVEPSYWGGPGPLGAVAPLKRNIYTHIKKQGKKNKEVYDELRCVKMVVDMKILWNKIK